MVTPAPAIKVRGKARDVFPAVERLAKEHPNKIIGDFLTCRHCGYTDPDVKTMFVYTGGRGNVLYDYCQDGRACWVRFDNGHN